MRADGALELARRGRLYPGVILHGATAEERQRRAVELTRALLCSAESVARPCGACEHCRRIAWPETDGSSFHPDFQILTRDLRTTTSAEATKRFLKQAYSAPFEARGQVFVVAEAETLSGEAADSLLKLLEEPPERTPRHFLLLAATQLDLLPTLRSRSLSLFLGASEQLDPAQTEKIAERFAAAIQAHRGNAAAVHLLSAAEALASATGWEDPRARRPWAAAAAAVMQCTRDQGLEQGLRIRLLTLAEDLMNAPRLRLRGITHQRILDGLVSKHLAGR